MQKSEVLFALGIVVIMIGAVYGGFMLSNLAKGNTVSGGQVSSGNQSYDLTIVITTNNWYNSTIGYEPAFFVLQNSQLTSSANISLPAGVPIHVTIINYDSGSAAVAPQFANVTGTVGNVIFIANNTNINSTEATDVGGISVVSSQPVSFVNDSNIAHTFTVQLGSTTVLNIPIEPSSVETAVFTLSSGVYHWHCMAACGSGSSGWQGAMDTPGWMAGTVNVS